MGKKEKKKNFVQRGKILNQKPGSFMHHMYIFHCHCVRLVYMHMLFRVMHIESNATLSLNHETRTLTVFQPIRNRMPRYIFIALSLFHFEKFQ